MKSLLQFTFLALIKSSSQFQYATHVEKQIKFPFNMLVLINPKGKFCIQFVTSIDYRYRIRIMAGYKSILYSLYVYNVDGEFEDRALSQQNIFNYILRQ